MLKVVRMCLFTKISLVFIPISLLCLSICDPYSKFLNDHFYTSPNQRREMN